MRRNEFTTLYPNIKAFTRENTIRMLLIIRDIVVYCTTRIRTSIYCSVENEAKENEQGYLSYVSTFISTSPRAPGVLYSRAVPGIILLLLYRLVIEKTHVMCAALLQHDAAVGICDTYQYTVLLVAAA